MKKFLSLLVLLLVAELGFAQCPTPLITGNTAFCQGGSTTLSASILGDTWTQKTDFGGAGRFYATGFSIGSKGYIGTGDIGGTYTKDFWEYDPATGVWTQKADFGGAVRAYATGFSIGAKGYIGTGYNNGTYLRDFWEYDPTVNTWTQKANFGGTGRRQAVGFSIGNIGYIGTGNDNVSRKDFWEYNPTNDTWAQKTDFGGTGRSSAVGFSIGTKGYIGTGYDGTHRNDFWEFDPSNNSWTQKANAGTNGRSTAVGFSIGSKGYIGSGYGSVSPTFPNDLLEYDPTTNTWTTKANLGGIPRSSAVGFSIGNKGYIGTGGNSINYDKGFWEYTPSYTYQWSPGGQTTSSITVNTTGNYTVTVTDGVGCNATSAPTYVMNNTPVTPVITGNPIICPSGSTTLTATDGGNTWVQKADFGGLGRLGAVGFSIGNKGYIGTGQKSGSAADDFWEYDPTTDTWTQKANVGGGQRAWGSGFSIGGKGYIGLGTTDSGKDFWEYDPTANTWTRKADFGGTGRSKAASFSIGTKGYIGTGFNSGSLKKDFWEYDQTLDTWTQKTDFGGVGRMSAVGLSIGAKGYIGTGSVPGDYKNDFWEYNPANDTWTAKANASATVRYDAVAFSIGSKGYLGTGYTFSGPANDLLEYNPTNNTWATKAAMGGISRDAATGFSIGGKGYIGTGLFSTGYDKGFWEYTPANTYLWSTGATTSSISTNTVGDYTVTISNALGCSATSATTTIKINTAPTAISLTANTLVENLAIGTVVGDFSTADADVGQTFTYTLVSGTGDTGNAQFTIVGDQLKTNAVFDYEATNNYSIRVKTTDGCATYEKVFTINITNVNEPIVLDNIGLTVTTPAAVAYSLRKLSSVYTGPAIKARQILNNAEADVAFDNNNNVSEESIITITAVGSSGFTLGQTMRFANFYTTQGASIVTWYDQSGLQRNMVQAIPTLQPYIVNGGAFIKLKNKPMVYFLSSNLAVPAEPIFTAGTSMVGVAKGNDPTPASLITKTNVNQPAPFDYTNSGGDFYTGNGSGANSATNLSAAATRSDISISVPESVYSFTIPTSGAYTNYLNGVSTGSRAVNGYSDNGTKLVMGNRNDNGGSGNFYVPEIILFNSVLSNTDRNTVENNQKTNYITVSANADLANLALSNGTIASFAAATTTYTTSVGNAITSTIITPTLSDLGAVVQVRINGGTYVDITSGYASSILPLNVGSNTINVLVTAQNNTITKLYTVTIIRLALQPTIQAKNIVVSDITATTATINWTNGDGASRMVFMAAATTSLPTLTNGTTYTANPTFGFGTVAGTGWYCVYNGTGTTVNVNGLNALTGYRVMVTEYNGSATSIVHLSTAGTNNPLNFTSSTANTTINAITRVSTNPTNAGVVNFTVTFGTVVSGLTSSNFTLSTTGVNSPSIASVDAATGNNYTVTVYTGSGSGNIKLVLDNATGITPGIGTTLPYTGGETFTIDKTITIAPTSLIAGYTGHFYARYFSASGGAVGTVYSFAVTTGTLPTGLTLTTDGLLSGTPSVSGNVSFTITATDETGESEQKNYTLSIYSLLPVGFTSFSAKPDGNRSKLEWGTLSETNNNRFEIERSTDGKLFSLLTTVKGNGTTTVAHNYLAYDNSPASGINYYRLKQYDDNNQSTILDTKTVNFKLLTAVAVKLYPNPTSEEVNLVFGNYGGSEVKIALTDLMGRTLHAETIKMVVGDNSYRLNLKNKLMPGQYIVSVTGAGLKTNLKLIVN